MVNPQNFKEPFLCGLSEGPSSGKGPDRKWKGLFAQKIYVKIRKTAFGTEKIC